MSDYKHQCRYCSFCVYTLHSTYWCEELDKDIANPKRPNKCKNFLFNEIPADDCTGNKVYKPRKVSPYKQDKLFNIPTDKQMMEAK